MNKSPSSSSSSSPFDNEQIFIFQKKKKKKEGNFQKGPWDKGHYARTSYVAFKKKQKSKSKFSIP